MFWDPPPDKKDELYMAIAGITLAIGVIVLLFFLWIRYEQI
jgi:hypothetical protein